MGLARRCCRGLGEMANGLRFDVGWVQNHFPDLANISGLSVGGQKTVFAATHATDGDVVLKLIHPGGSSPAGWYWSGSPSSGYGWAQRFSDGVQFNFFRHYDSSL